MRSPLAVLGIVIPLFEHLDDLAGPSEASTREEMSPFSLGDLVVRVGIRLGSLALLDFTRGVYTYALSFPAIVSDSLPSGCIDSLLSRSRSLSCDPAAPGSSLGSCCAPHSREPP